MLARLCRLSRLESRIQVGAKLGVWHEKATGGEDDDYYASHEIYG